MLPGQLPGPTTNHDVLETAGKALALDGDVADPEPELQQEPRFLEARRPERLAALAAARRGLPDSARDWSFADVGIYLSELSGMERVAEALQREMIDGEYLLELGREDALEKALGDDISAQLTLGHKRALRRAVSAIGGRPLTPSIKDDDGGETAAGTAAVAMAANRFISRALHGKASTPVEKARRGNLTEAQVKDRQKNARTQLVVFLAIEGAVILTGSSNPWLHLVTVAPGMVMLITGITAAFGTCFVGACVGGGKVTYTAEGEAVVTGA